MILRYVELRDFLSHELEQITLPDHGVIQLAGNSGSGKSSLIVDAVGFALFGFRATRASKVEDLRRLEAPGQAFGVKVAFLAADGTIYEVERGMDKDGRSMARINSSKGDFAEGVTPVGEKLRALFGVIDPKVYHRAFVARQDDISALTEMEGSKRRDFIHQMLGIDVLDAVGKRLRAGEREQGAIARHLEESIGSDTREQMAEHLRIASDLVAAAAEQALLARKASDDLTGRVQAEDAALVPLRARRSEIASRRSAVAVAEARLPGIDTEIASLDKQIAREPEARERVASAPGLREEIAANRQLLEQIRQAEIAQVRFEQKRTDLARLEARRGELVPAAAVEVPEGPSSTELRDQVADLTAGYRAALARRTELSDKRSRLAENQVCDQCLRPATGHDHEILERAFAEQLSQLESEIEKITADGRTAKEGLTEAEAREEKARARDEAARELRSIEGQIMQITSEISGADLTAIPEAAERQRLDERITEATTLLERAERAEAWLSSDLATAKGRREELTREKATVEKSLQQARTYLSQAGDDEGGLDAREASLSALRDEATAAALAAAAADGALTSAQAEERVQAERAEEHSRRIDELERARDKERQARDLASLTVGYRKRVTSELRPQLEETTSEVMTALSGGRHPRLRISEDYEISLHTTTPVGWLPVRMISGGEKTRANFALRLALTRLVSQRTGCPIRYLVMDEIFGSQDPAHRAKMLDVLRQVQVFYPQVFLISHVGDLRERAACDWIIEVADGVGPNRVKLVGA